MAHMKKITKKHEKYENFLSKYPKTGVLTADKFAEIWEHYDSNESGYIDADGLDKFFTDLLQSMTGDKNISADTVQDMKDCFMSAYDDAGDGRIAITELSNILPTDETFILLFRREEQLTSSVDLIELWRRYDKDRSGYINADELKSFIRDLLERRGSSGVDDDKLEQYTAGLLTIFDKNGDGRLGLKEMARILSITPKDNFLTQFELKCKKMNYKEKQQHFNKVFAYYDKSKTGAIEGDELDAFVADLMEPDMADISTTQVDLYKKGILANCDKNKDGKIQRDELRLCLGLYLDMDM
ncbi:secretagogin-like protein [Saccoglossus kowalevskii]|uniref:Secretagogin n=1 Tax=Saccoglossus kowalevskii TaxID=10224 RepID=D1LXD7_SACKO|nr:secretagogin-like protein [Saccoglossus kowalevskii]ACY92643.1 secretagogin-like protein [Saccoglossus kowalevskii]